VIGHIEETAQQGRPEQHETARQRHHQRRQPGTHHRNELHQTEQREDARISRTQSPCL
jgi:hypothetical protein